MTDALAATAGGATERALRLAAEKAEPMKLIVAITALRPSLALAQPLPQPKPAGGGSCPHGYTSSESFCVPREGAQDAVPLPPNGTCP